MRDHRERPFRVIDEVLSLAGVRVVVRAGLNVPLEDGAVRDDFRIKKACETLRYLHERGARVVVLAHLGRDAGETLAPIATALRKYLPVRFVPQVTGEEVTRAVAALEDGDVLLLENVRSDPREAENDALFVKALAAYGDLSVNDAFADAHREHASIVGVPALLPSYAGLLFAREYDALSRAFEPAHPALCILGGAKFETKLPLVERFVKTYDHLFIGGALANDFLKAKGYEVGRSLVSDVDLSDSSLLSDPRIILPSDVVAVGSSGRRTCTADAVAHDEAMVDVGAQTLAHLSPLIAQAKTILWNGPLGNYEDGYDEATKSLARMIAQADAYSIIGGGDTIAAIEALGLTEQFSFISTAGGAMLQFLEHRTLPGIEALARSVHATR